MTTRTSPWPAGTPCWVDLGTSDLAGARQFYPRLFGWTLDDQGQEYGGYLLCRVGDRHAAGIGPAQPQAPSAWTVYLASDDVDATVAAITRHGGVVLAGPFEVGPTGRMAVAADPSGATFGVWQHGQHIGAGVVNEPGALVWEEAYVPDPPAAREFYGAVFGWSFQGLPAAGPDYTTFTGADGAPLGGLGAGHDDAPPHWLVYFGVNDPDRAVAETEAAGGRVLRPARDTPYGRMAVLADPAGATFAVVASPADGAG